MPKTIRSLKKALFITHKQDKSEKSKSRTFSKAHALFRFYFHFFLLAFLNILYVKYTLDIDCADSGVPGRF
jgi:hypothetical protein